MYTHTRLASFSLFLSVEDSIIILRCSHRKPQYPGFKHLSTKNMRSLHIQIYTRCLKTWFWELTGCQFGTNGLTNVFFGANQSWKYSLHCVWQRSMFLLYMYRFSPDFSPIGTTIFQQLVSNWQPVNSQNSFLNTGTFQG